MASGQNLSKHQKGIVNRYYQNLDTISLQKLGEIVSELALCEKPATRERLWKRARIALEKIMEKPEQIDRIIESEDISALAALITKLSR